MDDHSDIRNEITVLTGLFQFGVEGWHHITDLVSREKFRDHGNRCLWDCLAHVISQDMQPDQDTVLAASQMRSCHEEMHQDENLKVLRHVATSRLASIGNLRKAALIMARRHMAVQLDEALEQGQNNLQGVTGEESPETILACAEEPLFVVAQQITSTSTDGYTAIGDGLDEYREFLIEQKAQGKTLGLTSGFPRFDEAIGGGLRRKTVNLIGARPKTGKTVFGDNVALHAALDLGIPVLYLDTEMSKRDHWNRMLANLSSHQHPRAKLLAENRATINEIERWTFANNGAGADQKKRAVESAHARLATAPYSFQSIAGKPFDEVLSSMRRWVSHKVGFNPDGTVKDCLIVYDYLKLMSSTALLSKELKEYQIMGFQMTALHDFAVRWDLPILAFVQLNREFEVSQSDRLIWLCSNWSLFERFDVDGRPGKDPDSQLDYNRKLTPVFQRHGAGMEHDGDYIQLVFHGAHARIDEGVAARADAQASPAMRARVSKASAKGKKDADAAEDTRF